MAKLKNLPSLAIISGFRKTIDFYVHDGVPCARKWPVKHLKVTSPSTLTQNSVFTYAARMWTALSPEIRDAYSSMAQGSDKTGRDLFTSSYLSNIYRAPNPGKRCKGV